MVSRNASTLANKRRYNPVLFQGDRWSPTSHPKRKPNADADRQRHNEAIADRMMWNRSVLAQPSYAINNSLFLGGYPPPPPRHGIA